MAVDISHLRVFATVYETLNYSVSARTLRMSRQGIRGSMQALEADAGHRLFRNEHNRLMPTVEASRLYPLAREVLDRFDDVEAELWEMSGTVTLRAGICMNPHAAFSAEEGEAANRASTPEYFNHMGVHFIRDDDETLIAGVLDGTFDFAWILGSEVDERRLDCFVSRRGRLHLCVPVEHPLAARGSVRVADLEGLEIGTLGKRYLLHQVVCAACECHGFRMMTGSTCPVIAENVLTTASIGTPCYTCRGADAYPNVSGVAFVPFEEPEMGWSHMLVMAKGLDDSKRSVIGRFFCKHGPEEMLVALEDAR